jgi:hypothetical protein
MVDRIKVQNTGIRHSTASCKADFQVKSNSVCLILFFFISDSTMLKDQIITDLTAAMKAGDELGKRTLRMLKAEVMKEEVAGKTKRELDEVEIVKIIKKLIKQRRDAAEQFTAGGRAEQAAAENEEITVLEKYLPEQFSAEKVAEIVAAKKAELGVTDKSKMGQLMGAVMKEVGDSADGAVVKAAVEQALN